MDTFSSFNVSDSNSFEKDVIKALPISKILPRMYNQLMSIAVHEKLRNFFNQKSPIHFKKGEMIIQPEATPGGVFYIREGVVRMYAISTLSEEVTVNTFKAGAFFPMGHLLNDTPISHYYEALTDVTVSKRDKTEFLKLLESNPDILLDLVKRIYRGLDGYMMKMETLMSGTAMSKLLTTLIIYAKRFGEKKGSQTQISLKLTEKELASQSGLARETVSRQLHILKEKSLISFEKNTLMVANIAKLEAELPFL